MLDFNDDWVLLESGMRSIFLLDGNVSTMRLKESGQKKLYENLKKFLKTEVEMIRGELDREKDLLAAYYKGWKNFKSALVVISDIFSYLDKNYVKSSNLNGNIAPIFPYNRSKSENSPSNVQDNLVTFKLGLATWDKYLLKKYRDSLVSLALITILEDREYSCSIYKKVISQIVFKREEFEKDSEFSHSNTSSSEAKEVESTNEENGQRHNIFNVFEFDGDKGNIWDAKSANFDDFDVPCTFNSKLSSVNTWEFVKSLLSIGTLPSYQDALELYKEAFENPYAYQLICFYSQETRSLYEEFGIIYYIYYCMFRIKDEIYRCNRFLDRSSKGVIEELLNKILLLDWKDKILAEVRPILEGSRLQDLYCIFVLLLRLDENTPELLEVVSNYILEYGTEKLSEFYRRLKDGGECSNKNDKVPISSSFFALVFDLYDKFSKLIRISFQNRPLFEDAMSKSFRGFINSEFAVPTASELLARYSDSLLRKSSRVISEECELNSKMKVVQSILYYVDDKDTFREYYSKFFAKRLISGNFISKDVESDVVSHLKNALGHEFTVRFQSMFDGLTFSGDFSAEFKRWLNEKYDDPSGAFNELKEHWASLSPEEITNAQITTNLQSMKLVDFSALIFKKVDFFTLNSWNFSPPRELSFFLKLFEKLHMQRYENKVLTWNYYHSTGMVKLLYPKKAYHIHGSVIQISVLLLFNFRDCCTMGEISEIFDINMSNLEKVISSLIKSRLVKVESGKDSPSLVDGVFSVNTIVKLNLQYKNARLNIVLPKPTMTSKTQETVELKKSLEDHRSLFIQATIMRNMKSRKILSMNELITLVIDQCKARFRPSIQKIKNTVEYLVQKEYLGKSEKGDDLYEYVT